MWCNSSSKIWHPVCKRSCSIFYFNHSPQLTWHHMRIVSSVFVWACDKKNKAINAPSEATRINWQWWELLGGMAFQTSTSQFNLPWPVCEPGAGGSPFEVGLTCVIMVRSEAVVLVFAERQVCFFFFCLTCRKMYEKLLFIFKYFCKKS